MEARISSARVRTTKGRIIYSLCFLYPFTTSVADPGERPMGPALLPPPPRRREENKNRLYTEAHQI